MVMNANLVLADWHDALKKDKLRNLDEGMYGPFVAGAGPENPIETTVVPRIVTLNPGQPLFRWVDSSKVSREDMAASPWWTSKRGAQQILARATQAGTSNTSEHARWSSAVKRSWQSDLMKVVHIVVTQPIKAFMGVGRDQYDVAFSELWNSHGLQLYIPQMVELRNGKPVLSRLARHHVRMVWWKSSANFDAPALERAMRSQKTNA